MLRQCLLQPIWNLFEFSSTLLLSMAGMSIKLMLRPLFFTVFSLLMKWCLWSKQRDLRNWERKIGFGSCRGGYMAWKIWNKTMNAAMLSWGFKQLATDPCIYYRHCKKGMLLVAIHIDDFLIASSSATETASFKSQLCILWSILDLGEASFCVGIAISHHSQTDLIDLIISTFGQSSAHPMSTPRDDALKLHHPT